MGANCYLLQIILCFHIVGLYEDVSGYKYVVNVNLSHPGDSYHIQFREKENLWRLTGPVDTQLELRCTKENGYPDNYTLNKLNILDGRNEVKVCAKDLPFRRRSVHHEMSVRLGMAFINCTVLVLSTDPQSPHSDLKLTSCPCGRRNKRPDFGAYLREPGKDESFCEGTILTQRHILTAASCTFNKRVTDMQVVIGTHLKSMNGGNNEQVFGIRKKHVHEGYYYPIEGHYPRSDIALLELSESITFSESVRPVCLPTEPYPLLGEWVSAVERYDGHFPDFLDVEVVDLWDCVDNKTRDQVKLFNQTQLCAVTQRDPTFFYEIAPGTPLLYFDPEMLRYVQVGLLSFREEMTFEKITTRTRYNSPLYFNTDVFVYYNWIHTTIARKFLKTLKKSELY